MKKIFFLLIITFQSTNSQNIVKYDVANFWEAYDRIVTSNDSLDQLSIIQRDFIENGSPGLQAMIDARRYTPEQYLFAIQNYPKFWSSIRRQTQQINSYSDEIEIGINRLKNLYPSLRPAKVYFTIGVFRSNGTTVGNKVLIGSEMALSDSTVVVEEFPETLDYFKDYIATNPNKNLSFLNIHEYIHTQQKTTIGKNLLSQTVIEGVAEFIASLALNIKSPNPQITFGEKNMKQVRKAFSKEMFSPHFNNWLWNDAENTFKMRDLSYYVGYAIAEAFYTSSDDKKEAIKEMIQLDYNDQNKLERFVNESGYFPKLISAYRVTYESNKPKIKSIDQFENGNQNVDSEIDIITVNFSSKMDNRFRGFDYGPLGEQNVLRVHEFLGFSEDQKSLSFRVSLKPNKRYQLILTNSFRDENGIPITPYLIDIKTN
ncbi:hypothetical protein [Salegentibacter maritimus]|uniref:DUF2268 domain-containing protein n=1 Tax=Salegentibacter maritimus TaxID=2794347 RepID=A0ABS0TI92_9FLAO|nr:hypothetical protein [Salegentibacter maritimus]MBI6120784.1 hypothetical protein [Salegentibacter maritimus]